MQLQKLIAEKKLPLHRNVPTATENSHRYCYKGSDSRSPSALLHVWDCLEVSISRVDKAQPSVQLFHVENITSDTSYISSGSNHLLLSPFGESCVEVKRIDGPDGTEYSITAIKTLPPYYPLLLAIGVILYLTAPSLSRNIGIYYSTSTALGVVLSLLLLLFIFYRMVPKSSMIGWGVLLGGYSVVASVLYYGLCNLLEILQQYWQWLVGYVVLSGLITFAVVYRIGTPDPRTLNLLQWGAQLVAVVLVGSSFHQLPWAAFSAIVLLWILGFFAKLMSWIFGVLLAPFWCCLRPVSRCLSSFNPFKQKYPKRRLLTMEEYDAVGEIETKLALEKLRAHCRSSLKNEDIWDAVSKLKDPKRFTEFLSGKSHISSQEQAEHDFSFYVSENTDDESETSSVPSPRSSPSESTTFHRNLHATRN